MSEIKDRQDAASDIDPIVAALADDTANDTWAAATVEGSDEAADPAIHEATLDGIEEQTAAVTEAAEFSADQGAAFDAVADAPDEFTPGELVPADAEADFDAEAPTGTVTSSDIAVAIEAALVDDVQRSPAATGLQHLPAAYADTIVELDPEADLSGDDAPLLDSDLEDGIASVFAALHAAREDSAPAEPVGDLEAADGVTFRLLGELDRLWHRAA